MATMKDVALKAGVSVMTVSRVINSPDSVKSETKNKILSAMNDLKFHPNYAAKALVTNRTRTVHLLIPNQLETADPYLMTLIAGISDVLSKNYYAFLLRREWDSHYKCDGVIAMGLNEEEDQQLLEKMNIPCVLFGDTNLSIDCINVNDQKGGYDMTNYILQNGHEKIGIIVIDEDNTFPVKRYNGYQQALRDNDIPFNPNYVRYSNNTEGDGFTKALELLESTDITALFCLSDVLALGALRAAREVGKVVPKEISIAGFDGVLFDQVAEPHLTTMKQPVYEIGQALASELLTRIENPFKKVTKKLFDPKIMIRNSTSKLNKD
ncbi:LacI family DNA-binding transcriptional regulator [Pseudalkalibacillus hwajinpoensis]|uniref:LacI family DNA-binding transcriptional regulator n=1 Tax=Guptibacillus hwajinpoensis TaxID=208199 RepID=UPI001CD6A953|nr:LacI family DNA-binding transcriptional regulator [Pseudalkalibacillus hwajinpoensis]MCA0991272.1 LacI family transcriptional regulator [Pseudalkalibacillus hwajinpoensis]